MGTDKGENFEVESGPYAGQNDRGPIWLIIGILILAGVAFGGYMYHTQNAANAQRQQQQGAQGATNQTPVGADGIPANNATTQQALPSSAEPATNPYGGTSSGNSGGQPTQPTAPSAY